MEDQLTVIYVAGSMQQAHLLKNLLEGQGIRSTVINDTLEKGAGVDYIGWHTSPRVLVDQRDAAMARQIALEHDRRGVELAQQHDEPTSAFDEDEQAGPNSLSDAWPRCPDCGKPRITRCPICKTTGTDFVEADEAYVWGMGLDEVPEETPGSPSCGNCASCGGHNASAKDNEEHGEKGLFEPAAGEDLEDEAAAPEHLVLMCPMCSEPFLPEFPRQCAWCGHEFDDGFEPETIVRPLPESNGRVTAIIVGLMILAALVVGYFLLVL